MRNVYQSHSTHPLISWLQHDLLDKKSRYVNRQTAIFLSAPFGSWWCRPAAPCFMCIWLAEVALCGSHSLISAALWMHVSLCCWVRSCSSFCGSMICRVSDSLTGRSQFVHPGQSSVRRGGQWSFTGECALAFFLHLKHHRLSVQLWATSPAEVFWRFSLCYECQGGRGGWEQDIGWQLCGVNWT